MKKALLSLGLGLFSMVSFAQMSGTYTINSGQATGGTNYQTFSAAVSALGTNGVSGPVTFNVIEGTYNETVNFPTSISGTSTTNTITFQSDASNTSTPLVTSSGYVINMSYGNLNNITFSDLNFVSTGSRCLYVYAYYSTSYTYQNINFENCLLESPESTSSLYCPAYLYGYYGGQFKFNFDGCRIKGGYYGIYAYLYYGASGSDIVVNDCDITHYYYYSAYFYGYIAYPKITFTNNYVTNSTGSSNAYGLYAYYSGAGSEFSGNRFELATPNYGYGVLIYYGQGTSGAPIKVHNNIINYQTVSTYSQYGLRMGYGYYNQIYHNTTNITNNYTSSYGAYMYFTYSGAGNEYKNNIVNVAGTSPYTMYCYSNSNSYLDMADNVYYAGNGSSVRMYAALNGTYTTVSAWQTASSNDAGSVSEDPLFTSSTNMIPQSIAIDNMSEPVGITTDIDGFTRSLSTPDPGAHEFTIPTNNAGISDLIAPDAPLCSDDTSVVALLKNTGLIPLTSCSLHYELNGTVISNMSISGSLAPGSDTAITIVSSTTFSSGDEIRVWSSMPNGVQDSSATFDTASVEIFQGMVGTFSVPGDYADLTSAAADVMMKGLCGHVVINIASGTYNEQINLDQMLGSSEDATLTWRSATGNAADVEISMNTTNGVVNLNGADWVNFEHVSIRNTTTGTSGYGVYITNNSEHVSFDHCNISTGDYQTTSTSLSAFNSTGNNHHLTISDCEISKGGYYGLYVQGNSSSDPIQNVAITNSRLENAYYMQTHFYYVRGFEFHNNVITNDTNLYIYPWGLRMYYVDNFNVTGNYIGSDAIYSGNPSYGGYSYPFYMENCIGSNNPRSSVMNNCINGSRPGAVSYGYYGFYSSGCGMYNFHNNSVTRRGGYEYNNYYTSYFGSGGLISVKNNSFSDYAGGPAMYIPGGFTVYESDNNNFYSVGNDQLYYGSTYYQSLEDYKNASGFDMNSIDVDPTWEDTLKCITCNVMLDNTGTNTSAAMYDIDSNLRSPGTPDIGAVEWVSPANFTLGGDSTYCADEVTIEAGPAQSVTWSVDGSSITAPTLTLSGGTEATTYNVLVTIQTEYCGSASDNALITLVPNAHLDSNIHICADENEILNPGGTLLSTYMWSNGATTQTIMVDEPGIYSVTKNELGCESSTTTVVTQSQAVQIIGTEVCIDDMPLMLDGTIANGISYAWSGGDSPGTAVNTFNDAGPYTITATDAFGCISIDSFEVVILEEPQAVITTPTYSGFIYVFDASSSPFLTSNSSVNWNFGVGASPATSTNVTETVIFPWSNPNNLTTYSVNLEINNGCGVNIATLLVTPDPTSIDELEAGQLAIFPNPASDVVTIATKETGAGNIMVLDMSGRTVASSQISAGSNNHELNISGLAAGAYIVKVVTDNSSQMKQLIVQ